MRRNTGIDILRIISAFAVVVIHIVSASVISSSDPVEQELMYGAQLIHMLMNWSVPVFFMITGYCLSLKQECTYQYCFSHVRKYISVLFTIGFFYALLELVFNERGLSLSIIIAALRNVISGQLWDHMWYVYAIIGIYLVMPVIHRFMRDNVKELGILTVLLFVFTILLDTFEPLFSVGFSIPFCGYLFYVCFGCLISQCHITKRYLLVFGILATGSVIWIFTGCHDDSIGYKHLAVCMMAFFIFVAFSKLNINGTQVIQTLSSCTWGIYLLHPLFINFTIKLLNLDVVSSYPYLKMTFLTIIIFMISFASTFVLRKIPLIKKLF